ncbi:MAG: DNA polymerase III subunit delta, partial [Clostridia bacterium]|nr:DNA polymerase III subunit delta [Clostridia bacterium]
PLYLITGDDFYYVKMALNDFKSLVDSDMFDFNISYVGAPVNGESLNINLQTPPLMSNYRVIFLSSDGKKLDKEKAKTFEEVIKDWLKNPCPNVVLVVTNEEDNFKFLTKIAEVVDCKKRNTMELVEGVSEIVTKQGYSINDATITEIIIKCNNDMMIIQNELAKLFAIAEDKNITYDLVDKIVINNIEQDIFKLTDNIAKGNSGEAYKIMNNLLASGEQPLKILAMIASQYRRMFICRVSNDSESELAGQLAVKPYAISVAKRSAKEYKPMQLKRLVDKLQLIEFQAKNGEIGMLEGLNLALIYAINRR